MTARPRPESTESAPSARPRSSAAQHFRTGVARAFGGAIVFSLPLLMTMEMWQFGFAIHPLRLAALLLLTLPLLVGLSTRSGFRETLDLKEDVVDACVAYAVGVAASAVILLLLGIIGPGMSLAEVTGKIVLQAVPASIGALLAQSQFGHAGDDEREGQQRKTASYGSEIFLMGVGALFLGFNVAPTEEMVLIGNTIGDWRVLALLLVSMLVMHAFVYALEFRGQELVHPGTPFWSVFLRFTIVGYVVALLISAYVLWTFGRFDGTAWPVMLRTTIVLGFPCAVGAAAARLIL